MTRRVLIICTGNSCRSQMAEGFLRRIGSGQIDVFSAGTHPGRVHPMAIRVMEEVGIDMSGHSSKSVMKYYDQDFDYIITVCDYAKAACPTFPGAKNMRHIPIEDPLSGWADEEFQLEKFRRVRNTIEEQMKQFAATELKVRV